MKKLFLLLLIYIGLISFTIANRQTVNYVSAKKQDIAQQLVIQRNVFDTKIDYYPIKIAIPKLNLETNIEAVGEDINGNMETAVNESNVGWYKYGTIPGKPGSAVISGHYDTHTGPGIFYELAKLQEGDAIKITDISGKIYTFQVTGTRTYESDQFPITQVFGPSSSETLNLITCEGSFDRQSLSYSHRLVVYSKLVK